MTTVVPLNGWGVVRREEQNGGSDNPRILIAIGVTDEGDVDWALAVNVNGSTLERLDGEGFNTQWRVALLGRARTNLITPS